MADGPKIEPQTQMEYEFGVCGECQYTVNDLHREYPTGTGADTLESTGSLAHLGERLILIVTPHRPTCSLHTNQKACQA